MKEWKCRICKRIKSSDDDIIMLICPACQIEMTDCAKVKKDGAKTN